MHFDFSVFSNPQTWVSLLTLTFMEIVLGIDNIIFISIIVNRLPRALQARGRSIGLLLALLCRIGLLLSISWIVGLKAPLFHLDIPWAEHDFGVTGRGPDSAGRGAVSDRQKHHRNSHQAARGRGGSRSR